MTDLFPNLPKVLSVTELTRAIRGLLETNFGAVWVQGEISNYKKHPSGHQYFTLKDQRAAISCVIFRNTLPPFPTPLADGMQVQVYGNVNVFEARGQYQLSVHKSQRMICTCKRIPTASSFIVRLSRTLPTRRIE